MKKKLIVKNAVYSLITKLIILILGVFIPRLLIISFGSEINGLLSTVAQIFTYLALLETGIGNSTINALYRPLDESDYKTSNEVLVEAEKYYRRVAIIYAVLIVIFSGVYPFFIKASISKLLIFGIIFFQGMTNFVGYYYTAVYVQLLTASGSNYINQNILFFFYIVTSIIKIILILLGYNVLIVQISFFIISLIKIPVYRYFCRIRYPWLNFNVSSSKKYLKERGAFVIHEISTTIFNNTDVFIISTFCNLSLASVYSVYNLIFSSVGGILGTVVSGLGFVLGQSQYKDKKKLIIIYDIYSSVCVCVSFIFFTTSYLLIFPFIRLYTAGIQDTDYIVLGLPLLFTLINLLSGVRVAASMLITVSGHASKTRIRSIVETLMNLIVSLILVNIIGIKGVLWGTIIALLYRSNDMIIYTNKKILNRNPIYEYRNIVFNFTIFIIVVYLSKIYYIKIDSYIDFMVKSIIIFVVISIIFILFNFINNFGLLKKFFKENKKI